MEGKGAAAWMLLLASLLLLALSPSPTSSFENDDERPTELSSRRIRRDVGGGVWLPVELQQLAEDEIRREAQKPRRKHKRRSQHNPEEEERRRRLWEQQERRRVDEERRRAHEPPRPEEPPQPTTRRPTYEERLREWQRQKEEHDRLVREREKEYEALTVRPLGPPVQQSAPSNVQRAPPSSLSSDDDEEENERKLQDYIERNTPINAPGRGQLMAHSRPPSSRQPWGAAGQRDPYESHEQRGYPAYDYNGNEPERNHHHREGSEQLTPEDERQIAEYHERLETQLAQLHGPARQEFERQARQREDEYRRRLQQDHLREKTGCNQTSSSSSSSSSGVKGQAQRRPPPASSSVKGAVVDPCASGPYPPYGDARYANRGPDGRPCPPPAPAQSRGETKGPSNDRDPYEQYRRAQESRYRPEQSKGPQPDNRYEEQRRAAEARWRAEQNKGPVVDPYAELRRAEEARYLAQQNKGPPAPYEESRRAQEEARYRAEQNKGAVTPPPPQGRYDEQSEPDWRRVEEMRRAEDSTWIQPAASKGSSNGRPNEDRQETLQPEVWNRVYQASYHRAGDPAESSTHEEQQQPTRPQRPQSAGAPSRYGSHPAAAAAAARPNHHSDDDQAGSMSNVRYEEHRRNEAVVAPGTNPVKQPESGRQQQQQQQQQQHNANQTAAAAHSTTSPRPPATTAAAAVHPSRNATTENHAPNALRRNDNAIDFMRGLRPDRPGPVASNFPAPVTPRPAAAAKSPSACVWAVVVCCRVQRDPQKLVRCFEAINCPDGNWDEGRCAPPIVGAANHEVGQFYRGSAAARTTTTAQR